MPKILFFGHRPYPNEHAVLETVFTRYFPEHGYQTIWVLQPKTVEQSDKQAEWNGMPVYITRRRHWSGIKRHLELFLQYLRQGKEALHDHEIDIVQARTGLPEGLVAWWLAKRHNKLFVFQYSFPTTENRRIAFQNSHFPWLAMPAYWCHRALIRFLMAQADLVLAVSNAMRDEWIKRGIKKIIAFPLGADTRIDPHTITPVQMPPNTVIYFGALDPARKLSFLVDAFSEVLKKCPTAHLLLVGDSSGSGLEAYAEQIGIRSSITFTGQVSRVNVPNYIRSARCAVAPIVPDPQYLVASTTKVLESFAMAVPVVANREIQDQREVIEQSGGGYTPPYDVTAFADAILKLLSDPQDAIRRGESGYEFVIRERSYEVLSGRLLLKYQHLLSDIK